MYRFLFFLSLIVLLAACTSKVAPPFQVEINEHEAMQGAHIFQGKDSLVAIGSAGGLDVLLVYKENGARPLVQLTVINPGDSALEFSSLKLYSRDPVKTGKDALWHWTIEESETGVRASLDLSGSSVCLLPEERLLLPPLYFFSHLCSE